MYGLAGNLGRVTWSIYINFRSPFPRRLHIKFGFDRPDFSEKMFESNAYTCI